MPKKDARIDSYIADAPEFAQPILKHLRKIIHEGCPEIEETLKWSQPFFEYKGLLCGFAAFKAHCALIFWRDIDVRQALGKTSPSGSGMGQFGRITSLADLPERDVLLACVRSAVEQRNSPAPKARRAAKPAKPTPVPADLKAALGKNRKAATTFENFAPSHRREYIDWITEAKRPETREKRLQNTIEWLSEGKKQNWKYLERSAGK